MFKKYFTRKGYVIIFDEKDDKGIHWCNYHNKGIMQHILIVWVLERLREGLKDSYVIDVLLQLFSD